MEGKVKVLITDGLAEEGMEIFRSHPEIEVDLRKGVSKEELINIIKEYDALIVRSATKVTADVLKAAGDRLKVVGRAGIGVDNIDVNAATKRGVVVMNTPEANAITTAEHTLALMLSLARKIPQSHISLSSGEWKRDVFRGTELYGKTLGVIGLGKIGKLVAERALGLKMRVIAYDPFLTRESMERLGVEQVTFDELLKRSDVITIHTPITKDTRNLLNREAFAKMKKGVMIINCARGGIVNEADLAEAIKSGQVAGASVDVYEEEPPPKDNPLFTVDSQVVHTPHLGASTREAQTKVGTAIAEQVCDYLINGVVRNAVNMPSISRELAQVLKPYVVLAEKLGKLQGQLCKGGVKEIAIEYSGDVADYDITPLTVSVLKGFLTPMMDITVNHVNAPIIARERGISVVESKSSKPENFTNLITVGVKTEQGEQSVAGTVFDNREMRIVSIFDFPLDAVPEGCLLVSENLDVPGVIGSLCTKLGQMGINIARMHLGRESVGGRAIAMINVDSRVPAEAIKALSKLPNIINVRQVEL